MMVLPFFATSCFLVSFMDEERFATWIGLR
jgi:hypothetical protein